VSEPVFVSRTTAEAIHLRSLDEFGGQDGIRDEHALESALAQPMNVYYYGQGDLFDIAAAYAFHLAENQPFVDGNKRTAITTALLFLEGNGIRSIAVSNQQLYDAMIAIAEKRLDKAGLAAVFRRHLAPPRPR
jgi:death-on-curing protein